LRAAWLPQVRNWLTPFAIGTHNRGAFVYSRIKTPPVRFGHESWGISTAPLSSVCGFVIHTFILAILGATRRQGRESCSDLKKIVTVRTKLFKSEQIFYLRRCCVVQRYRECFADKKDRACCHLSVWNCVRVPVGLLAILHVGSRWRCASVGPQCGCLRETHGAWIALRGVLSASLGAQGVVLDSACLRLPTAVACLPVDVCRGIVRGKRYEDLDTVRGCDA
jgi:hypothetical protein